MKLRNNLRNKMILILFLTLVFLMSFKITVQAASWDSNKATTYNVGMEGATFPNIKPNNGGNIIEVNFYKVEKKGEYTPLPSEYSNGTTKLKSKSYPISVTTSNGATKFKIVVGKECSIGKYRIEIIYKAVELSYVTNANSGGQKQTAHYVKYMHNYDVIVKNYRGKVMLYDGSTLLKTLYASNKQADLGKVKLTNPTKNGYTFKNWLVYSNGQATSKEYNAGQTITVNDSTITLKAQWTKDETKPSTPAKPTTPSKPSTPAKPAQTVKTFTVIFNANGGTGTMSNQKVTHGNYNNNTLTKLNKNQFKKTNYKFIGWYAKRSADGYWYGYNSSNTLGWYKNPSKKYLYKDQAGVARTVAPGASVTMYAQWEKVTLSSISVLNKPTKLEYFVNDTLDIAGLKIQLKYNDGKIETKTSGFTCLPTKLSNIGNQKITVTYNGKTTSFNVTVKERITLGDMNEDGKVNELDAQLILDYTVGKQNFTDIQKARADVNKDGKINSSDALEILKKL